MAMASNELTSDQLQRMEENKRKAKDKLTATLKLRIRQGRGSGTPTQSLSSNNRAGERDAKQSTPVKSKQSAKITFAVCPGEIIDGKHEAIFCEGQCKKWYHRGCASVSKELLAALTASDEPFYCLMCSQALFKLQVSQLLAEIDCLKTELKVVPAMQASIDTLKKEVADLRRLSTVKDHDPPVRSYAKAAASRTSRPRYCSNSNPANSQGTATSSAKIQTQKICPAAVQSANSADNCVRTSSEAKTKVLGVRRIWGTMRSATTFAVTSTLKKLTNVGNQLSVKRKSRPGNNNSGKSAYWFVIKSSEDVLKQLGEEWDQVQLQIGWRLEDCYKPSTSGSTPSQSTSSESMQTNSDECADHTPAPAESHVPTVSQSVSPKTLSPAKKSPMQNDAAGYCVEHDSQLQTPD